MAVFPSDSIRTKNWGTEILTDADLEAQFDLLHAYLQACLNATTGHVHDGSANQGPKLTPANLVIASQAQGDVLYASSASAWARLGAGTDGQFLQTKGAAANPVWANAGTLPHDRVGMYVMQASTITITVAPGSVEINGATISKTTNTTLTLTTAGDWAGGVSQQAVSTLAYVIIDASGNIKMTTTAPTHADYGVSITAANNTKRYATVSAVVYRYIGWFYMNATGSGQLDTFGVSNLADGGVKNVVEFKKGAYATGSTAIPADDSIPQITEGDEYMTQVFRPTNVNNKLKIEVLFNSDDSAAAIRTVALFQDSTANALACVGLYGAGGGAIYQHYITHTMKAGTISLTTFRVRAGSTSGSMYFNGTNGAGLFGGDLASSIRVEEIESQLT